MVVEVMGRHAGWIATYSGIAGGATVILVPEQPFDIEEVCKTIRRRHSRGRYASICVVAEGAVPKPDTMPVHPATVDQFGHVKLGGIAYDIAAEIERRTGFDTRVVVLGHIQRGGTPNAYDRVLSTRYGLAAIDAVHDEAWGEMVVYSSTQMQRRPLSVAVGKTRTIGPNMYHDVAEVFFG
jgi:6-phosphofructokinase 1